MTEQEIRIDEQKKLGKALKLFMKNHELEISFLAALEQIFKKMAAGKYDTSELKTR